jgi:hypothetical protein
MAAVEAVCAHLKTMSRPVTTPEEIAQVLFRSGSLVIVYCGSSSIRMTDFRAIFFHDIDAGYPVLS